jgi:uncharacterized protein YqgC (DUF456 family)
MNGVLHMMEDSIFCFKFCRAALPNIVPFVAVFLVELSQRKEAKDALKVAVGTIIGFLSSTVAKVFIQLGMIGWFFLEVFI